MSHATEVREEEAAGTVALERRFVPAFDAPAIGAWVLPFALILLLAFSGGGYDPIVRGQVGILLWWFVLVGAATGSVAVLGGRWAWAGVTLLAAFAVWTGLAITWTESTERTVAELARVATLLGVLVLALASQRHVAARHAVNGAACAIAVVAGAAVLSRLQPGLFGVQQVEEIFPTSKQRLSFPVGYWNLLAGLAVIGLPLLLAVAGAARTTVGRALATAALPVVVLCVFLTVSRGAIGAAGVAVVVFFLLAPDRLPKLAYAAIGGVGGLVLCLAADNRDALQQNLGNALAQEQGDALLGLTILVCLGAALLAAGVGLADRHATRPRWTQPGRKFTSVVALAVVVLGLVAFVGGGGPGWAGERADEFKAQTDTKGVQFDDAVSRLQTVSGNGRYQYWQAAERAKDTDALKGIGPGTFEFWWAREGTISGGFVRDSHSLWADALAETGLVGFTLLVAFFLFVLLTGAIRALRAVDPEHRSALAAATAGVAGFAACASIEWAWEMTVLPAAALGLAAVALAGRPERPLLPPRDSGRSQRSALPRGGLAVAALLAIAAIGIPTAAASDLRDSQVKSADGDIDGALERVRSAADVQPYAASVQLQEALLYEQGGRLGDARSAAVRATEDEPTNWRNWVIRSRLEIRTGRTASGLRSYERARDLNPRSLLFRQP